MGSVFTRFGDFNSTYMIRLGYLPRGVPWVAGRPKQGQETAFAVCVHHNMYPPGKCLPFSRLRKAFQDVEQFAVQLLARTYASRSYFWPTTAPCSRHSSGQW